MLCQSPGNTTSSLKSGVVQGYVHINGGIAIGRIDSDFICATLDWWPPEKCDYGTWSWGFASLLNLVLLSEFLILMHTTDSFLNLVSITSTHVVDIYNTRILVSTDDIFQAIACKNMHMLDAKPASQLLLLLPLLR